MGTIAMIKGIALWTQILAVCVVSNGMKERKFVLEHFPGWILRFCFLLCVWRLLSSDRESLLINKAAYHLLDTKALKWGAW